MPIRKSKAKDADLSWESAITDAEKKLRAAQLQVYRLERAIETFRRRRAEKDPFPGQASRA